MDFISGLSSKNLHFFYRDMIWRSILLERNHLWINPTISFFPNIYGDKTVDIPNKIFSDTASDIDERNKGIQIYKIPELASVCNKHSLPILHDLCI